MALPDDSATCPAVLRQLKFDLHLQNRRLKPHTFPIKISLLSKHLQPPPPPPVNQVQIQRVINQDIIFCSTSVLQISTANKLVTVIAFHDW